MHGMLKTAMHDTGARWKAPLARDAAGWGSSSRACEASSGRGMTPGARRRDGPGEILRFATAKTSLGWVLIAAMARGICAAELGDDPAALAAGLRRRRPAGGTRR